MENGEIMEEIACLLIVCLTCIAIVWLFTNDRMHDLVIKLGDIFYINIKKHEKE